MKVGRFWFFLSHPVQKSPVFLMFSLFQIIESLLLRQGCVLHFTAGNLQGPTKPVTLSNIDHIVVVFNASTSDSLSVFSYNITWKAIAAELTMLYCYNGTVTIASFHSAYNSLRIVICDPSLCPSVAQICKKSIWQATSALSSTVDWILAKLLPPPEPVVFSTAHRAATKHHLVEIKTNRWFYEKTGWTSETWGIISNMNKIPQCKR